jgi:RNA polymerase sigma-70 factor, ECF subfamily
LDQDAGGKFLHAKAMALMLSSRDRAGAAAESAGRWRLRVVVAQSADPLPEGKGKVPPLNDTGLHEDSGLDERANARTVVDRARAGDPEAFHAIFQRYAKPVLAFLYHLVGDRPRAEELAQETFFRAFRSLQRMPEGIKLSTWIFGIARNVARESMRDMRRARRHVDLDEASFLGLPDEKANPDETFIGEELQRAIRRFLVDLSEDQRVVFILKLLNKMRYQEISLITGSSVGKLKTDLHRARQLMREKLQPYLAGRIPEV